MVRSISDFKGLVNGSFNPPPRKTGDNADSEFDGDECESVAATVVSAPDSTAQSALADTEQAEEETTLTQETVGAPPAPTTTAAATPTPTAVATPTPPPAAASTQATSTDAEPMLTTYGSNHQVGIRFLRRSLYKSMSQYDGESICGSQTPTEREAEAEARSIVEQQQKEQSAKVSEISRRNLRKPKTKQRLEQAMRKSVTPEYTPVKSQSVPAEEVVEESPLLNVTSLSEEAVSISEVSTRIPPLTPSLFNLSLQHDNSEVIDMSSTEESPRNVTTRTLRLRKRNATTSNSTPATASTPGGTRSSTAAASKVSTPTRRRLQLRQ